jgi:hypothetical protein
MQGFVGPFPLDPKSHASGVDVPDPGAHGPAEPSGFARLIPNTNPPPLFETMISV